MDWIYFLQGGAVTLAFVTAVWLLSLIIKNSAIMDIFWGLGFIVLSLFYAGLKLPEHLLPKVFMLLVILWGLRLSVYIFFRNLGKPEDARYAAWRAENGNAWWWRSYLKVFLLQGVIMWFISLQFFIALRGSAKSDKPDLLIAGTLLWLIGFFYESVGDWQMSRFKKDPANSGKVMDRGLWKHTRHPNYFGEAVMWWGFFLFSISSGNWLAIISPLIMTFLLLRVSGVAMLDALLVKTKPEYADYIRRTSAFIPWKRRTDR